MHKLQVIFGPDFFKRPAQLLSTFGCQVGTDYAQYRIHGVIHRTGINGKPGDLPLQCPVDKLTGGSGVHVEITNLVRLAFTIPVALIIFVVAGMHHHNIARLDPYARLTLPLLKVLRGIDLIIPNAHGFQVHYYPRPHQFCDRSITRMPLRSIGFMASPSYLYASKAPPLIHWFHTRPADRRIAPERE